MHADGVRDDRSRIRAGRARHRGESAVRTSSVFSRLFEPPGTYGWSEWDPRLTGGSDSIVWFVAPATLLVRDESDNDESFPYRVSGVLERAGDAQWLFRLFNGSEPVTAS